MPAVAGAVRTCEPLAASAPVQLPEAVQAVAYVELQLIVVVPPATTDNALKDSVGAGGTSPTLRLTDTGVDCVVPLVQVSVYVAIPFATGVTICVPSAASVPLQSPLAVQLLASIVDHVSVVEAPKGIVVVASVKLGCESAASACMNPYPAVKL